MSKVQKIEDKRYGGPTLTVTQRSKRGKGATRVRVTCVCGARVHNLDISYRKRRSKDIHADTLEINGVTGTVAQMRELLLPLLGLKEEMLDLGVRPLRAFLSNYDE